MVRVSNTLLPTNSSGVPQTEITNSSLAVSGSFYPATQPISASSLPLPSGAASETTLSSVDGKITACDTGAVVISSGSVNATCSGSVAVSSVSGTVSVSQSSTISGTSGNLDNATSVVDGDFSSAVSVGSYTKNTIMIESSATVEIQIEISPDGGTNYYYYKSCYPMESNCVELVNDVSCDTIRLKYKGTSTITASVFSRA